MWVLSNATRVMMRLCRCSIAISYALLCVELDPTLYMSLSPRKLYPWVFMCVHIYAKMLRAFRGTVKCILATGVTEFTVCTIQDYSPDLKLQIKKNYPALSGPYVYIPSQINFPFNFFFSLFLFYPMFDDFDIQSSFFIQLLFICIFYFFIAMVTRYTEVECT